MESSISSLHSHSQTSSALDEILKSKGIVTDKVQETQNEDENSSQSMTIANFSTQSVVMANANSKQNSLLASVMGAASSSTAETSNERTAFGKQTAANMLQGMEKDNFEQNVSDLLEGLRTDIEEAAEEKLNETTGVEENTSTEATSIVEENVVTEDGQSTTSASTVQTTGTTAQVVTEAQSAGATPTTDAAPEASSETAESSKESTKSVDTYV